MIVNLLRQGIAGRILAGVPQMKIYTVDETGLTVTGGEASFNIDVTDLFDGNDVNIRPVVIPWLGLDGNAALTDNAAISPRLNTIANPGSFAALDARPQVTGGLRFTAASSTAYSYAEPSTSTTLITGTGAPTQCQIAITGIAGPTSVDVTGVVIIAGFKES